MTLSDLRAALQGQRPVPGCRGVPRAPRAAAHAVQRGELAARRRLQPRRRLRRHQRLVLIQQRLPGHTMHGLRSAVSPRPGIPRI